MEFNVYAIAGFYKSPGSRDVAPLGPVVFDTYNQAINNAKQHEQIYAGASLYKDHPNLKFNRNVWERDCEYICQIHAIGKTGVELVFHISCRPQTIDISALEFLGGVAE